MQRRPVAGIQRFSTDVPSVGSQSFGGRLRSKREFGSVFLLLKNHQAHVSDGIVSLCGTGQNQLVAFFQKSGDVKFLAANM